MWFFYQQYCSVTWMNYRFVYIGAGVERKTTERYECVCTSAIKKVGLCILFLCEFGDLMELFGKHALWN